MSQPIPVIPLAYAPPEDAARRFRVALPACEALGLAVCVIGWLLLFATVESVLVTGPLILLIGAAMVGMGVHRRDWARVGLGASHVGICVLFVSLVNLLRWSPRDADLPFKLMGGGYLAATAGASVARVLYARAKTGDALPPPTSMSPPPEPVLPSP